MSRKRFKNNSVGNRRLEQTKTYQFKEIPEYMRLMGEEAQAMTLCGKSRYK